ncbi:hypothetical protein [Citricoccus sp. GCM10030269]|uniref:hypothetical protein n=1 Tax=Citricoccus sp. GCM10030269 TaxID=3273388 RepID=UPI00360D2222
MTVRRWARGIAVMVIVAAVVGILVLTLSRPSPTRVMDDYSGHPASPTPSPSPSPSSGLSQAPIPAPSAAALPESPGESQDAEGRNRPTWDPAAQAPEGADVQPKVPLGLGASPYRLPHPADRPPVLTEALVAADAEGKLAEGFPEDLMPVTPGAEIRSSSVSPQGQRVLVGVRAVTGDDVRSVVRFYTQHCGDRGWPVIDTPTTAPTSPAASRLHCGIGTDSLTVTAMPLPTGRVDVTLMGAFDTGISATADH